MVSPINLADLHSMLSAHSALLPVSSGVLFGVSAAFFRGSFGRLFHLASRDSKSLMNFSQLGTLQCVCGEQHPVGISKDRRQFCRSCGCEVVAQDGSLLDKQISRQEIKSMTRNLRRAAIRASHLELPPTITTVEELHRYLDSSDPKHLREPRVAVMTEHARTN